jgi:hypothetical protein
MSGRTLERTDDRHDADDADDADGAVAHGTRAARHPTGRARP